MSTNPLHALTADPKDLAFRVPASPRAPEAPSRDEAARIARAQADPDAFAALYREHYPAIARYIRRRVGELHTANDLIAETFLTAIEHLPRYRHRGLPFRAWLHRLAVSRLNRWVRRRRPATFPATVDEQGGPAAPVERTDAPDAVRIAREALLALPPRYQTVLSLHYLEGQSVAEIAAVLGCRPGTVKARLARGRERLRRLLEPHRSELFG